MLVDKIEDIKVEYANKLKELEKKIEVLVSMIEKLLNGQECQGTPGEASSHQLLRSTSITENEDAKLGKTDN